MGVFRILDEQDRAEWTTEIRYEEDTGFIFILHVGAMGADDVLVMTKAIDDCCKLAPPGARRSFLRTTAKQRR